MGRRFAKLWLPGLQDLKPCYYIDLPACRLTAAASSLQFNTTSAYFAENFASMNRPQWDGSAACGRCIKVWCTDARCTEQNASKVLQIVDQCGHCQEGESFNLFVGINNIPKIYFCHFSNFAVLFISNCCCYNVQGILV